MQDYVTEHPIIGVIRQWLCDEFGIIYTGNFKLYLEEDNYGLGLEMGNFERPIIIGGQFESDEDFINYYKKEFRIKQLYRIELFRAVKNQSDEMDDLFFINDKGEPISVPLIDNRHIRQIQNEHNP